QDRERRHRLARPALAYDPERLARFERERDAVYRAGHALVGVEVGPEVLHLEQRHQLLSRGSSASRSPSPTRLKASTVTTIARPGNVASHHAPNSTSLPSATILPHEGAGSGTPSPRNESPASSTIVLPMPSVAATMTGASTLGTRCRRMMRGPLMPSARAASMNSRSRRLSTSPRTMRVVPGHCVRPS